MIINQRKLSIIAVSLFAAAGTFFIALAADRLGFEPAARDGVEITDMSGNRVLLPHNSERLLSLSTTATAIITALGAAEQLAAIDQYSQILPGASDAAVIGKGSAISREKIISLDIDAAFIWWYQDDAAAVLDDLGIPAVRLKSPRAAELADMIKFVGGCIGKSEQARQKSLRISSYLEENIEKEAEKSVYFELYSPLKTVGAGSYINDLLALAGLRNIAAEASGSVILSIESLIEADPEIILFVEGFADEQSIKARNGFGSLAAVANGQIFSVNRLDIIAGTDLIGAVNNIRKAVNLPLRKENE